MRNYPRVTLSELGRPDEVCADLAAARALLRSRVPGAQIDRMSRPKRGVDYGTIVEWSRANWRRPGTVNPDYDGAIVVVTEVRP